MLSVKETMNAYTVLKQKYDHLIKRTLELFKDMGWKEANDPPPDIIGRWTETVVAITNYGDIFLLSHFDYKTDNQKIQPTKTTAAD